MNYMKLLGLFVVAAAALMGFAGSSSATTTEGINDFAEDSETFHAESLNGTLHGPVQINCSKSTLTISISGVGSTNASVSQLNFTECGKETVSVLANGSLSFESNGVITSSGTEITMMIHQSVFGVPITTHCIYKTNGTIIGNLTEGNFPKMDLDSGGIEKVGGDGVCPANARWTGNYKVKQAYLEID